MILRRRQIDRCRTTRTAYLAALNVFVADEHNETARRVYAAALLAHCAAMDQLNQIERSVMRTQRISEMP